MQENNQDCENVDLGWHDKEEVLFARRRRLRLVLCAVAFGIKCYSSADIGVKASASLVL